MWQPGVVTRWDDEPFPEPTDLELLEYGMPRALLSPKDRPAGYPEARREA